MWIIALLPFLALLVMVLAEAQRPTRKRRKVLRVRDALLPEETEAHFDALRKKRSDEVKAFRDASDDR